MTEFAAVDLGASSGRVMLGSVRRHGIDLVEVHRFANRPVHVAGTLHWDILALWAGVVDGLRAAGREASLAGIGVDSWAVDYGLLDDAGALLGNPIHYRDKRTDGVAQATSALMSDADMYATTGIQQLPFNTVYQLVSAKRTAAFEAAAHALLIPDLFTYWLTGSLGSELTNASTTALLDTRTRSWSLEIINRLGLRADLLAPVRESGTESGGLLREVAAATDLGGVPVFTVGSHDTASAVAGIPARTDKFAYISCGTWSLVGVELSAPITTEAARDANFSNELGIDGTIRFLRNVMGLWLLQESIRGWERAGATIDLFELLAEAAALPGGRSVVDPDRLEFLPPGDMPARLRAECRRIGQPEPSSRAEVTRCVLDSLVEAYRRTVREAVELSGADVQVIHLVGGGAQNPLLCQLTADACGLPVIAGPVEAAAYGNVLVQARAAGVVQGDLAELRQLLRPGEMRTFRPRSGVAR
jgi:rhamnulokinase